MDRQTVITPRRGLLLVLLVGAAFFASWFNRYVPPTNDGEAVLMTSWGANYLPYRDFFSQAPPGLIILTRVIIAVGGPHLLATLTFGVLLRLAAASAVYALLLLVSRPSYAALATLTGLFVSSTDISDTPFYYNHIGASCVILGTYFGYRAGLGTKAHHRLAAIAGGALLTFALAVKQTMVFGSFAAFLAMIVLLTPRPKGGWVPWVLGLAGGGVVTVGAIWSWLQIHHLTDAFLFTMRRAPEGKGGVVRSMLRPITLLPVATEALFASVAAWIVIGAIAILWVRHRQRKPVAHAVRLMLGVLAAGSIGLLLPFGDPRVATLFLTALGWWGALALAVVHVGPWIRRQDPAARALVALGGLSFGIGYCFAVSWPLFENHAFPGLAVATAAVLAYPPTIRPKRWVTAIVLLGCLAMAVSVYRKFTVPHIWGGWIEPPLYSPRGHFEHPALAGLAISDESASLFAMVARISEKTTSAGDPIYVYPNLPILYAIADRRPVTYALVHWVDTTPDFLGREDAARLTSNPPRLLLVREHPMSTIEAQEGFYRGGEPSSVRDVIAALEAIKPLYSKVAVFDRAGIPPPLSVYVRKDVLTPAVTRQLAGVTEGVQWLPTHR